MWTKVWLLGGRSDDMKEPGDYICTEIGKESVLIVRQADGSVRAFPNVCLHRGNKLRPEGRGNAEQFRCMYHHWTYDLDGAISPHPRSRHLPAGRRRRAMTLPSYPCEEWGSFVWFSLNPDVEPLDRLPRADAAASRPLPCRAHGVGARHHGRVGLQLEGQRRRLQRGLSRPGHPPAAPMVSRRRQRPDRLLRQAQPLSGPVRRDQPARRAAVGDPAGDPRDHGQGGDGPGRI